MVERGLKPVLYKATSFWELKRSSWARFEFSSTHGPCLINILAPHTPSELGLQVTTAQVRVTFRPGVNQILSRIKPEPNTGTKLFPACLLIFLTHRELQEYFQFKTLNQTSRKLALVVLIVLGWCSELIRVLVTGSFAI